MSELRRGCLRLVAAGLLVAVLAPWPCLADQARGEVVMVVSAHPLATAVGVEVLQDGGNAVDAAVAVAFALAVVEPYASGVGGGGFAVTFTAASGAVRTLDYRETAPAAARRDIFLVDGQADTDLSQDGLLAVAVPGMVRGLWELQQAQGGLPWARLLGPAVTLARVGFPVSAPLRERIAYHAPRFNDAAREIFLPGGELPAVGQVLVQADLAATLQAVAERGPDAFYAGPCAEALVALMQDGGGLLTGDDLAAYRPRWRQPVQGTYRGLTVFSMPPPSSGGVHLVQMLNILAGCDLSPRFLLAEWEGHRFFKYDSAPACHLLIEAMKFAYADRSRWLGDPDFVIVPVGRLTSMAYADSLRDLILPDRALPWQEIPGARVLPPEGDQTSHLSVVDADGNAAALTLTINLNFGSGLVAPGTGVLLNDEMDDFVAAPGVPNAFGLIGGEANAVAPGKRPLSSMTPTIVLQDDRVLLVAGGPGGSRIITSVLQVILDVVDEGLDIARAVAAPRLHHQWYPPVVYYESTGLTAACWAALRERGHDLKLRAPMGNVQAIWVDPATGVRWGASDPRGMGAASGY